MAKRKETSAPEIDAPPPAESYTVLARRYRPQQFGEIVGQEPVAKALVNALESNRVAHAYLFTGARGVGKTSTARILAKALNCVKGPTATPCDACEICRAITSGQDVDVIEIDGASNNKVEEVREIRQNVQYRPSRSRYKIYIIDEVHMLSTSAFNALLKTLEEPPPHVKFIFATTEVHKIPVTILSRCQRFDFAGIGSGKIVDRLRQVVAGEQVEADDDALELVARRAGGSMRDAQSLLDQLLAFGGQRLTSDDVHRLLGTAHDEHVIALAGAVLEHEPKRALELLAQAEEQGLQLGELLDQLVDYWRDLMVVRCAGSEARDLSIPSRHREALAKQAGAVSLDTILAGLDILGTTKYRLRGGIPARYLLEMALVRLGRLDDLVSLAQLGQWLNGSTEPTRKAEQKPATSARPMPPARPANPAPAAAVAAPPPRPAPPPPPSPAPPAPRAPVTTQLVPQFWPEILARMVPSLRAALEKASEVAIFGPNTLVIRFAPEYNAFCERCQDPACQEKLKGILREQTQQAWNLRIEPAAVSATTPSVTVPQETDNSQPRDRRQRDEAAAAEEPLVKRAREVLDAKIVRVDEGFGAAPPVSSEVAEEMAPEET